MLSICFCRYFSEPFLLSYLNRDNGNANHFVLLRTFMEASKALGREKKSELALL